MLGQEYFYVNASAVRYEVAPIYVHPKPVLSYLTASPVPRSTTAANARIMPPLYPQWWTI